MESAKLTKKVDPSLPPVMMVTLNRFYYDREAKKMRKRLEPVKLSPSITIKKSQHFHTEEQKEEEEEVDISTDQEEEIIYDLYVISQSNTIGNCDPFWNPSEFRPLLHNSSG